MTTRTIAAIERDLARAQAKSTRASVARAALPAGSSRARVTSANARWMRAAEDRDRFAVELADAAAAAGLAPKPCRFRITRRNSTVLGYDARGQVWAGWWRDARWDAAIPTRPLSSCCLNVPVPDADAGESEQAIDDRAWYRVRPKRDGGMPVRVGGVWFWEYPKEQA